MQTILWIHGFPLSSRVFAPQRAIGGVRHVMFDLPGFGDAPPISEDVTMKSYARHAIEQLNNAGIDRAVFAGLSMGGYICFEALRLAPERVAGLILLDTRETADTDEARKGRFEQIEKVRANGVQPVVDAMLPKMLTPSAPSELVDEVRAIMTASDPDGVIGALRAMAERPDSTPLLATIDVPTLIVVGENDGITPPSDAERMARAIANARVVRVANAAHLANLERAGEVNAAIEDFVRSLP